MLKNLLNSLKTSLEQIPNIQVVYNYPVQDAISSYPAIVFYPSSIVNDFNSTVDNEKVYNFDFFILINMNGTTTKKVTQEIMPQTIDDVFKHIDENWNAGTIDGHRVWTRLSVGTFGVTIEEKNKLAVLSCTLVVKALTDN